MSFRWLMEQALYHPQLGYYSSGRAVLGRGGDYFTSVSVGPLFGRMLAAQFAQMWELLGRPAQFAIVEQGAAQGDFARDVLTAARTRHREFFEVLRYVIVEPFVVLAERQRAMLAEFSGKVAWRDSLDALDPFLGIHFSNELLDAMPVHLLRRAAEVSAPWRERHVAEENGELQFVDLPIADAELAARAKALSIPQGTAYETEIALAPAEWIASLARKLERGFVLAIDYGYARDLYYSAERTTGTLRAVAKHRVLSSPFSEIGEADITAHVEWTSVAEAALVAKLDLAGFTDQHHFLTGIAASLLSAELTAADAGTLRSLQTLLHPSLMGMQFQTLLLARGINQPALLAGWKFARSPRRALNLA